MIILYPQTIIGNPAADFGTPLNPFGCWDWWGYTDFNYAVKAGRQIATIKAMLDRLTSGHVQNHAADPDASFGLIVNDASDSGITIAWTSLADAGRYTVSRAAGRNADFTQLGSVSEPSFGDMGLRAATSYSYRVAVTLKDGSEGPSLPNVIANTLSVPPRCDTPGSCVVAP
jgi:hypothetical protein